MKTIRSPRRRSEVSPEKGRDCPSGVFTVCPSHFDGCVHSYISLESELVFFRLNHGYVILALTRAQTCAPALGALES